MKIEIQNYANNLELEYKLNQIEILMRIGTQIHHKWSQSQLGIQMRLGSQSCDKLELL
jgi:hypothetical protein